MKSEIKNQPVLTAKVRNAIRVIDEAHEAGRLPVGEHMRREDLNQAVSDIGYLLYLDRKVREAKAGNVVSIGGVK